jgi:hypothetical protein
MKTFKGYNVPDVGEFVSDEVNRISESYCWNCSAIDCESCATNCDDCLFGDEGNDEFQEWHEARKNGIKLEE